VPQRPSPDRAAQPDAVPGPGPEATEAVQVPTAKVALSTTSTYPESAAVAFELAARLGYDGVELMVFTDPVTQEVDAVRRLSDHYGVPVLALHAPCLLVTQRVWGTEPWPKLERSRVTAEALGASTVVVHPPFRWQREYARGFVEGVARMSEATDVRFAVENMYPWKAVGREAAAYAPGWDPSEEDYAHVTLDLSHTAVSGSDALELATALDDRLAHLHLTDGSGSNRDEHLVPGRGSQRCAEVLEHLAHRQFTGTVVVEVSTRKAANRAEREADLAEALAFARLNLAVASDLP
jgi:sugar phosphate isomerase/epimerase